MEKKDLISFMSSIIGEQKAGGYHGTAHIYPNSLNSFIAFYGENLSETIQQPKNT